MWVGGQRHALAALLPGKRSVTHCIGDCVGPRHFFFRYFEINGVNIHRNPSTQMSRKDYDILKLDIARVRAPGRDKKCQRICYLLGDFTLRNVPEDRRSHTATVAWNHLRNFQTFH